jgi:hypothetical protein
LIVPRLAIQKKSEAAIDELIAVSLGYWLQQPG